MKIVKLLKLLFSASASQKLARLDAHLLADFGAHTTFSRHDSIRVPADLGFRLT